MIGSIAMTNEQHPNEEHVEWLKEGVEKWNARRESDPFTPDLEDADIYREFNGFRRRFRYSDRGELVDLKGINLQNANLKDADLSGIDFTCANLQGADLTDARCSDSNFTDAQLQGTDLTNTSLRNANFTDASLQGADFTRAEIGDGNFTGADLTNADLTGVERARHTNFTNANLTNANLVDAELEDANLAGTQPWKAKLYPVGEGDLSPKQYEGKLKAIASVRDLLERIQQLQDHHNDEGTRLYFRGESQIETDSCPWVLQPSVMRPKDELREKEGEMLRDLISRRPEEFSGIEFALSEWVLAQHHGLPTRFLDITRNPLVAMFMACREKECKAGQLHIFAVPRELIKPFDDDTIKFIAALAKLAPHEQKSIVGSEERVPTQGHDDDMDRLAGRSFRRRQVQIKDYYKAFVIEPQQSPERIRAQSGAFLASAFHERFEPEEIRRRNESIPVYAHYKLVIPGDCKSSIRNDLRLLNTTEETLFPGPDSSAAAVKEMHMAANNNPERN